MAVIFPCLSVFAQPTRTPHQNPAIAEESLDMTSLLLFYGNVFNLAAIRQYEDAQGILAELEHADIPDELRYLTDRYNSLSSQLFTAMNEVEFLLDKNKNFYFLEVNARLQVEHPVTELTTGVDLVHQQILIASGEKLPFKQEQLEQKGHSIECRIYAEDPANNFLPSSGKVLFLKEPQGPGVRHDSGIYSGCDVPIFYDPILSKLIVWAENRELACQKMVNALNDYIILGIRTSIDFLKEVVDHPQFRKGNTTTDFINTYFADWDGKGRAEEQRIIVLMASAFSELERPSSGKMTSFEKKEICSPWSSLGKWRIGGK